MQLFKHLALRVDQCTMYQVAGSDGFPKAHVGLRSRLSCSHVLSSSSRNSHRIFSTVRSEITKDKRYGKLTVRQPLNKAGQSSDGMPHQLLQMSVYSAWSRE